MPNLIIEHSTTSKYSIIGKKGILTAGKCANMLFLIRNVEEQNVISKGYVYIWKKIKKNWKCLRVLFVNKGMKDVPVILV